MKKTRLHAPALVGVLVSVVAFSAGPAWGDQSSRPALGNRISKCGTISKPGSYVVTRNLTANGDCLVVAADFVTIDLGGWVITGNGTGSGITDQEAGRGGITVRNGEITGFEDGVLLRASSEVVIEKVRAFGDAFGISAGAGSTVSGNIARGLIRGIGTGGDSIVSGNIATGNEAGCIVAGSRSIISGNLVTEGGDVGIAAGQHSTVSGNTADSKSASVPALAAPSVATLSPA